MYFIQQTGNENAQTYQVEVLIYNVKQNSCN